MLGQRDGGGGAAGLGFGRTGGLGRRFLFALGFADGVVLFGFGGDGGVEIG